MPRTVPLPTREEVNRAGQKMVTDASKWTATEWLQYFSDDLPKINNWRAALAHPLNTFQMNLRRSATRVDSEALIAQRTKRLVSIEAKLKRFPKMKLSQMQDIGGCRAVVKSVAAVRKLVSFYLGESAIKHQRASIDDYIAKPQPTGYRGIHLVYR